MPRGYVNICDRRIDVQRLEALVRVSLVYWHILAWNLLPFRW